MDNDLNNRFFQKKLQELLTDSTRPFPTFIFEMERSEVIELVRKFCMYSPMMIPFRVGNQVVCNIERLETGKVKDYGDLYYLIIVN